MNLLVVIVNYKTAALTADCLASLEPEIARVREQFGPAEVVVTDNASGDGSAEAIESTIASRGYGDWARLMPLPRNGGFAYGNNGAIRPALESDDPPTHILLLNPDTVVRDGAIVELLKFMQANDHVGITGSRLEDPDGTPQRSAFRFPGVM
ncbi:MAG: glycosyltransferase, partial [Planctomycetota bacterium]